MRPASAFLEVGRHMGATLPDGLSADGKVAGLIGYSRPGGVQGILNCATRIYGSTRASARNPQRGCRYRREQYPCGTGDGGIERRADSGYRRSIRYRHRGRRCSGDDKRDEHCGVADRIRASCSARPPFRSSDACRQGTWRGWVRYVRDGADDAWLGAFELHGARFDLDGMRDPVRIASALVEVSGPRVAITQMRGHARDDPVPRRIPSGPLELGCAFKTRHRRGRHCRSGATVSPVSSP